MDTPAPVLRTTRKVVLLDDLSGHAQASRDHDDLTVATFLHDYYCACERIVTARGGTVVKFIGDACLSTFPEERAADAVRAAVEVAREVDRMANERGLALRAGSNIHLARFVEGEVGCGASRHTDVLGRGINQTFLMGRGPGVRISEPVYRKLPSGERTPWRKHNPPAVYTLTDAGAAYEGLGKSPAENAERW